MPVFAQEVCWLFQSSKQETRGGGVGESARSDEWVTQQILSASSLKPFTAVPILNFCELLKEQSYTGL